MNNSTGAIARPTSPLALRLGLGLIGLLGLVTIVAAGTTAMASAIMLVPLAGLAGLLLYRPIAFLAVLMSIYAAISGPLVEYSVISLGTVNVNATQLFVVAGTAAMALRIAAESAVRRQFLNPPRAIKLGFLLAVLATVGLIRSPFFGDSVAVIARMMACVVAAYFAYTFCRGVAQVRTVFAGMLLASIIGGTGAVIELLRGGDATAAISIGATRAGGTIGGPVGTGTVLLVGAAAGIAALNAKLFGRRGTLLCYVAVVAAVAGIFATFTRTAIVGFAVFLLALLFRADRRDGKRDAARKLLVVALSAVAIANGLAIVSRQSVEARLADIPGLSSAPGGNNEAYGSGRSEIWKAVARLQLRQTPLDWVIGSGLLAVQRGTQVTIMRRLDAHNSLLDMLFDLGLIGLLLYVAHYIRLVRDLHAGPEVGDHRLRRLCTVWQGFVVAEFFSTMMFNGFIYAMGARWYNLILCGVLYGALRIARTEGSTVQTAPRAGPPTPA